MKGSFSFQIALALSATLWLLDVLPARAQWDMHRLPGGSTLETVIVNETDVKGMWVIEKQAGAYWVQWNETAHDWDALTDASEYDAYYPWFMGGDERNIGGALYTLVATYQGTHRYSWDGDSWEPDPGPNPQNFVANGYYRWHDDAFVADEAGDYDPDHFIVCSVPEWSPDPVNEYRKGLYLIVNGAAPAANATPIPDPLGGPGSLGHFYSYIYRDMDQGRYLYTWYHDEDFGAVTEECDFQKVTVSGTLQLITAAVASDFDRTALQTRLKNVNAFYQYTDGATRHQFILAKSVPSGGSETIDVWHREHSGGGFSSSGWTRICQDLDNQAAIPNYDGGSLGLAAYRESDNYIIYLVADRYGLVHIKVPVGQPQSATITPFSQDAGDGSYLRNWSDRSLNLNPWWRASHPDQDQVIIGSAHADLHLATVNNPTTGPMVASYNNIEDWSGYHTNGTTYKGGPSVCSYVAGSASASLFIHDGTGIFRATTDPWAQLHYDQIGTGGADIQLKSDFNFTLRSGVISPFEPNYLLVGGARTRYFWDAGHAVYHGGIWKLNLAGNNPMESTTLANEQNVVRSMAADASHPRLYYAGPDVREDFWYEEDWELMRDNPPSYLRTSITGSGYREIANTGATSLNQHKFVRSWLNPQGEELYAGIRVLKRHPANGVTGVVYGLTFPIGDMDWGEASTETGGMNPHNQYVGGGLGFVYFEDPNWPFEEILDIAGHTALNVMWFENVLDMVVESNTVYSPPKLNVDILAACGAYQISRKGEDYPRYGGLFKICYNDDAQSWVVTDVTPPTTTDYQLSPSVPLDHPAVTWVDSVNANGTRYYFCTTMGDKLGFNDEPLCLLWYQQAATIRDVSNAWTKWDATGLVYYLDPHGGSANDAFWAGWAAQPAGGTLVNLFLGGVVAAQINLSP